MNQNLTVSLDAETIAIAASAWKWLVPEPWIPVLCSAIGDIFLVTAEGSVFWLDCGQGTVKPVADSVADFRKLVETKCADEWFLPRLVEALRSAGKALSAGQVYSFAILPIFSQGKYTVENLKPVDAKEHFSLTAHVHKQIQSLPDGSKVTIKIVP